MTNLDFIATLVLQGFKKLHYSDKSGIVMYTNDPIDPHSGITISLPKDKNLCDNSIRIYRDDDCRTLQGENPIVLNNTDTALATVLQLLEELS